MHRGLGMSTFETEGNQQPLVLPSWAAGAGVWERGGDLMVKGRGICVFRAQGHFPSLVFCAVGAVTVLLSAPRASVQTLPRRRV